MINVQCLPRLVFWWLFVITFAWFFNFAMVKCRGSPGGMNPGSMAGGIPNFEQMRGMMENPEMQQLLQSPEMKDRLKNAGIDPNVDLLKLIDEMSWISDCNVEKFISQRSGPLDGKKQVCCEKLVALECILDKTKQPLYMTKIDTSECDRYLLNPTDCDLSFE